MNEDDLVVVGKDSPTNSRALGGAPFPTASALSAASQFEASLPSATQYLRSTGAGHVSFDRTLRLGT